MFNFVCKATTLNLPIDLQLELFDLMVLPIMLYGSEVWGHEVFISEVYMNYSLYDTICVQFWGVSLGL